MSDEQLNTAIDEVARRMTEGSPAGDAGFRRRVLARIETADAPRARWRRLFVVVPLAAAIAIAAAVFVSRDTVRVPPAATDAPTIAAAPPSAATAATPVREALASPIIAAAPRLAEAREVVARAEADSQIDPITVAPLLVDTLTPESIQIPRLDAVVPIAVAPLDSIEEQRRYE
jgi:hypothetical protein